jgi:Domain of unknown function (DUF4114)/PEP-CTERM motif
MNSKLFTNLLAATATITGLFAGVKPVEAASFTWNNSWTQPTIQSQSVTGFNHAPFQAYVQNERLELAGANILKLDPKKLLLNYDHNVSAYFINEGAGYRNQMAYQATGTTNKTGLVFNDVSSNEAIGNWGGDALDLGDGVNLGLMKAGTQLDFFLRADGLNRGNSANIFGTQTAFNPDGLQHLVAYGIGRYVLLGFEDLYGDLGATGGKNENSDRDFNDVVMVVDVGEGNVRHMAVPEPSITLSLAGMGAAGVLLRRRRQKKAANS